jgi:putative membrane protein
MQLMHTPRPTLALALLLAGAIAVPACKGKDQYANGDAAKTDSAAKADTTSPAAANATGATAAGANATGTTTPAGGAWTSPAILGFATNANTGEVELGKLAESKGTAANVKAYGRMMVTDHTAMLKETNALATKLGANADTTADNARDLGNHARDEIKELSDKPSGADWDKNYIDKAIDDHQKVLDKLQDASKNTTDPEVRAALEKTTGKVQQHLTKAQDIKATFKS